MKLMRNKNLEIMEDKKMPDTWEEYLEMKGIDRTDTIPSNHISLYVARDEGYAIHYDDGGSEKIQGKLHIFYERPLLLYVQGSYNQEQQITVDGHFEWKIARGIGEIPSYMFPEIQEKKYLRFDSII